MLHRFVKPAFFVLLVLGIAFLAQSSGRGSNLLESSFHMARFADYASASPFTATLMLLGLSLPAILFFFVPGNMVATVLVSACGFWPGFVFATTLLVLAGGVVCACTRLFLHGLIRRWMAARRRTGRLYVHRSVLSIEYCLLFTVLLSSCMPSIVLTALILGLCGMRAKAFCIAAFPVVAARAAMDGMAVVSISAVSLVVLGLLGTLVILVYLAWVGGLCSRRMRQDSEKGPVTLYVPNRSKGQRTQEMQLELLPGGPAADKSGEADGSNLAMNDVLVVCVREDDERETAALVVEEARAMGARVLTCRLNPHAPAARDFASGFADRQEVRDLDELMLRGFAEGAGRVLAVRAISALVRRDVLQKACDTLKEGAGLVLGECGKELYIVAIAARGRGHRYERGLLEDRDFTSDVAFALAGYAPHPARLDALPPSSATRPLVSVLVLAAGASATLAATVRSALRVPWTEVTVVMPENEMTAIPEKQLNGIKLMPLTDSPVQGLAQAVKESTGRYLLFARDGIELPVNFDADVYQTLRQEKCRAGGFSLPLEVPSMQRASRWFGTVARPAVLSGPGLEQGLFVSREDYTIFAAARADSVDKMLAIIVEKAGQTGRVMLHNARVRFGKPMLEEAGAADESAPEKEKGGTLAAAVRGKLETFVHRGKTQGDDRALAIARLKSQAAELVASCDHCGRCTHVSPMLHRHKMDLADLVGHPLLAWHCFVCGACLSACHKGIDAIALARILRQIHVLSHGGRLVRPGHSRTVLLAKVPVYARRAKAGVNLLLEPAYLSAYPHTAAALARKIWQAGMGVIVADSGALLADLGVERQARACLGRLRKAMEQKDVTGLLTVSPVTQRYLVAMGVNGVEPVLSRADTLKLEPLSMEGRKLLVPCADRARKSFLRALAPYLRGSAAEIDVPCCGAGGEAAVLEPRIAARLKDVVRQAAGDDRVLTSCAGCAQALTAAGVKCDLDISELLGVHEQAATGPARVRALISALTEISALEKAGEKPAELVMDKGKAAGAELVGGSGKTAEQAHPSGPAASDNATAEQPAAGGNARVETSMGWRSWLRRCMQTKAPEADGPMPDLLLPDMAAVNVRPDESDRTRDHEAPADPVGSLAAEVSSAETLSAPLEPVERADVASSADKVMEPAAPDSVTEPEMADLTRESVTDHEMVDLTQEPVTEPEMADLTRESVTEPEMADLTQAPVTEPEIADLTRESVTEPEMADLTQEPVTKSDIAEPVTAVQPGAETMEQSHGMLAPVATEEADRPCQETDSRTKTLCADVVTTASEQVGTVAREEEARPKRAVSLASYMEE